MVIMIVVAEETSNVSMYLIKGGLKLIDQLFDLWAVLRFNSQSLLFIYLRRIQLYYTNFFVSREAPE